MAHRLLIARNVTWYVGGETSIEAMHSTEERVTRYNMTCIDRMIKPREYPRINASKLCQSRPKHFP